MNRGTCKPLKYVLLGLLFLVLLGLPSLVKARYYYRRRYVPSVAPLPDYESADVPTMGVGTFEDAEPYAGQGVVVIDRAHDNMVHDEELSVLLSRLTTRNMEAVSLTEGDVLPNVLRSASALVVISPHRPFSSTEIDAVSRFVQQGGRLLLVADPSRYSSKIEYDPVFGEYTAPASDVPVINGLASAFGLGFADDYLYNTAENAGNYQYVIFRDFAESPLTSGLDQVILYAAHSIAAHEQALVLADFHTTSSLSEQSGGLVAVGLGGNGRVLAVGDFTFVTEPYHSTGDNDRLIANIADFLSRAERTYGLTEFPHFFGDVVDLVLLASPLDDGKDGLSSTVVEGTSALQSALESHEKTLRWWSPPDSDVREKRDALYLGLYGDLKFWPEVDEILSSQGISFTLETVERERATPSPTAHHTFTTTPTPADAERATATPTSTAKPLRDLIHVPGMRPIHAKETALFYQNEHDGRQVLIVLAFSETGLNAAVDRLLWDDFAGCLMDQDRIGDPKAISLALCPTVYEPLEVPPEAQPTPTPTPIPEQVPETTPTPVAAGGILIVSDDNGEGVYEGLTSAYFFEEIVTGAGYQATVWSTFFDGQVTSEQMLSYDAVIWCTGDYQEEGTIPSESDFFTIFSYLSEGGRLILTGAFIGDPGEADRGLLLDIQVEQADHPLAQGLEAGQIIDLERSTADQDYAPFVLTETDPEATVFVRGPESAFAKAAVVTVDESVLYGNRVVLIGFPIYLLPYEVSYQLGTNAVLWIMGD